MLRAYVAKVTSSGANPVWAPSVLAATSVGEGRITTSSGGDGQRANGARARGAGASACAGLPPPRVAVALGRLPAARRGPDVLVLPLPAYQPALWACLGFSAVVATIAGVRRYRPRTPQAWHLFAAAEFTFVSGDTRDNVLTGILHYDNLLPSVADLFYLLTRRFP